LRCMMRNLLKTEGRHAMRTTAYMYILYLSLYAYAYAYIHVV
jgi:hypothetical protein